MTQPVGQLSVAVAGAAVSVVVTALAASVVAAAGAAAVVVVVVVVVVVAGAVVLSPLQPAAKIRTVNSNSNFFMMYSLWWLKKTVFYRASGDGRGLTSPA
ncbi:MAG TPA: hypothetical protein VFF26_13105 [Gallionella sp.]|nr:hypothetical protein [Gallionella sp.]